jgi:hypothetical protein
MSYSMGSIDCIALHINEDYLSALKKDVEEHQKNPEEFLKSLSENQRMFFENILDYVDTEMLEDLDEFCNDNDDINRYESGSENYAYSTKYDINSGELIGTTTDNFDGYVYPISYGSSNLYKPEFKDKEELLKHIFENIYVPKGYKIENNVIFLTGVWGG